MPDAGAVFSREFWHGYYIFPPPRRLDNSNVIPIHGCSTMVLEDIQPQCHGTRDVLTDILVC